MPGDFRTPMPSIEDISMLACEACKEIFSLHEPGNHFAILSAVQRILWAETEVRSMMATGTFNKDMFLAYEEDRENTAVDLGFQKTPKAMSFYDALSDIRKIKIPDKPVDPPRKRR